MFYQYGYFKPIAASKVGGVKTIQATCSVNFSNISWLLFIPFFLRTKLCCNSTLYRRGLRDCTDSWCSFYLFKFGDILHSFYVPDFPNNSFLIRNWLYPRAARPMPTKYFSHGGQKRPISVQMNNPSTEFQTVNDDSVKAEADRIQTVYRKQFLVTIIHGLTLVMLS